LPEKPGVGIVQPNISYSVKYEYGLWTAWSYGHDIPGVPPQPYGEADPGQREMNIRGRIMKFNEYGQVFYGEELVGTLKCGLGSDC
jgi:hypothetical protein